MWTTFWLSSSLAVAHVGAPVDAVDVHAVDADARVLEASIGLGWTADGEDWRWVCHEAITTPEAVILPRYAVAGRRWLATVPRLEQSRTEDDAVYWTDDGCTWTASMGLSGHEVPAIDLDVAGLLALAVTADASASANGIWRSADGGTTFDLILSVDGHQFTSVLFSNGDSGVAVAGSYDNEGRGWLHWSADAGLTWESRSVVDGEVVVMAVHPSDAELGYFVVDGVGVETLYRTGDAGRTVEELLAPDNYISDVEVHASGAIWVAVGGTAFLHAADGRTLELVTEAPPGLGVAVDGDRVLLATRYELVNDALSEGSLAEGFTPQFSFASFDGALECPSGTRGQDVCAPLFRQLQVSLGLIGDTGLYGDTGETTPGTGAGGDGSSDHGSGTGTGFGDSADPEGGGRVDPVASKDAGCGGSAWVWLLPLGLFGFRRPRGA